MPDVPDVSQLHPLRLFGGDFRHLAIVGDKHRQTRHFRQANVWNTTYRFLDLAQIPVIELAEDREYEEAVRRTRDKPNVRVRAVSGRFGQLQYGDLPNIVYGSDPSRVAYLVPIDDLEGEELERRFRTIEQELNPFLSAVGFFYRPGTSDCPVMSSWDFVKVRGIVEERYLQNPAERRRFSFG